MTVAYEWDIETVDPKTGDIVDHNFNDDLAALLPDFVTQDPTMRLCLVRHVGDDLDGETDRLWAYMDDHWNLPRFFERSDDMPTEVIVPKRYHRMIARAAG